MRIAHYLLIGLLLLCSPFLSQAAESAKPFDLKTDTGHVKLSDFEGRVVYIDFWASWCTPCRKSFPWMNAMQQRYEAQGLSIIAINLDQKPEQAKRFLKKMPANFTVAYDPEGKTAEQYNVQGMPSSYLIDRKGQIRQSHIGFRQKDREPLEQALREILNEK
jgi:cytochrome c biogenesis protein CcmG/thiol:disulfide interchange protein DsbE